MQKDREDRLGLVGTASVLPTMPIVERDPWRTQYFEGVACPDSVTIPTDDAEAYLLYPAHRWIYNKLLICETQGLEHGPHGLMPSRFPVF
ncbi:MAG TPA: hypothetical protein VFL31_01855, partial [Nitrospiraceae bacterium]|nr:hypothetical protein [Nitrospiraceae bacterium]